MPPCLGLPQYSINRNTPSVMWPFLSKVPKEHSVIAAGVEQRIGKHRQASGVEVAGWKQAFVVSRLAEPSFQPSRREGRGRQRAVRGAEDVAEQAGPCC